MRPLAAELSAERRRRLTRRLLPAAAAIALVALAGGRLLGARHESSGERAARSFAEAWERRDYAAMHALLTPDARAGLSARATSSAPTGTRPPPPPPSPSRLPSRTGERDGGVVVPMTVRTRVFGRADGATWSCRPATTACDWTPHLLFPGLDPGEELTRQTRAAQARADHLRGPQGAGARAPRRRASRRWARSAARSPARWAPADDAPERRKVYARGFDAGTPDRDLRPRARSSSGSWRAGRPGRLLAGERA